MCARGQLLFFLSLVLLSLSFWAFAQDGGTLLPVPESLQSSPESLGQLLSAPPMKQDAQIKPGMTREKQLETQLAAWIDWYKREKVWREKVINSWPKVKDFYEKADAARLKQIQSRDIQIAALMEQIKSTQAAAFLAGAGGFAAGFITDRLVK